MLDSDRFKITEEETRKILDAMEWDKIAEELRRATAISEAWSPIIAEVKEDKEEIEMEKIEKDTETLVDSLANYKDSYISPYDDIRDIPTKCIMFDDGATTMFVPVEKVIDKLIDFLIN